MPPSRAYLPFAEFAECTLKNPTIDIIPDNVYFKRPATLATYYSGPAGPYFDDFIGWLNEQGFQFHTIRRRLYGAAQIADWAAQAGWKLKDLNFAVLEAFGRHLAERGQFRHPGGDHTGCYLGAQLFLQFLIDQGVVCVADETGAPTVLFPLLHEFNRWMQAQRGVTEATLSNYRPTLLELLEHVGEQIDQLTAKNLRQFVLDCAARHGKGRAKTTVTAVRMFVRFLITTGHSEPGLDDAIPTIAQWRLSSLPHYLPAEEIEQLIESCDTRVSLGIRDRAVLLLLARLGLRAGDVAGLQVTDVNWRNCQNWLPSLRGGFPI